MVAVTWGLKALSFAEFLQSAGQRWWQMLPVGPVGQVGNSPYSAYSAFAGSPLFVSLELLCREGLIDRSRLADSARLSDKGVLYRQVGRLRESNLRAAFERFRRELRHWQDELESFRRRSEAWLNDYTTFSALKRVFKNRGWISWPKPLRHRDKQALAEARRNWQMKLPITSLSSCSSTASGGP